MHECVFSKIRDSFEIITEYFHLLQFELLYIEVLYTIKHKIGTTSGGHLPFIQDLYLYAREAFGVTPEDHARLLAKASEEKVSLSPGHSNFMTLV